MGKDRLYFLTFISIMLVFIFGASIGVNYCVKISVNLLLELELEANKKEVQRFTYYLSQQSNKSIDQAVLIDNLQEVIYAVEPGVTYMAVLDRNNKVICHPKITEIDKDIIINRSLNKVVIQDGVNLSAVYDVLMNHKKILDENGQSNQLEILYEKLIRNTDLKIVSIVNFDKLLLDVIKLKRRLYTIFILMGVIIISISFITVRFIGSYYEKKLEAKNLDLENDIINITKLNLGVFTYQQKIMVQESKYERTILEPTNDANENQKIRLVTYKGNEIIPISTNDIAYIYTENSISYIVGKEGEKFVSKASLDEICGELDGTLFFRANRQFIIHIINVEKIIIYGNSQLKIIVANSDVTILIKKNRVAEFKRWLNV